MYNIIRDFFIKKKKSKKVKTFTITATCPENRANALTRNDPKWQHSPLLFYIINRVVQVTLIGARAYEKILKSLPKFKKSSKIDLRVTYLQNTSKLLRVLVKYLFNFIHLKSILICLCFTPKTITIAPFYTIICIVHHNTTYPTVPCSNNI